MRLFEHFFFQKGKNFGFYHEGYYVFVVLFYDSDPFDDYVFYYKYFIISSQP